MCRREYRLSGAVFGLTSHLLPIVFPPAGHVGGRAIRQQSVRLLGLLAVLWRSAAGRTGGTLADVTVVLLAAKPHIDTRERGA